MTVNPLQDMQQIAQEMPTGVFDMYLHINMQIIMYIYMYMTYTVPFW